MSGMIVTEQMSRGLRTLAEGRILCPITDPRAYEWVADPEGAEIADNWLAMIGMKLSRSDDDLAFYATNRRDPTRDEINDEVSLIAQDRVANAFEVIYRLGTGIGVGDSFNKDRLLQLFRDDPEALSLSEGVTGGAKAALKRNHAGVADALVSFMEKAGYVIKSNRTTGEYRITGKKSWFDDAIENMPGYPDEEDEKEKVDVPVQGTLL